MFVSLPFVWSAQVIGPPPIFEFLWRTGAAALLKTPPITGLLLQTGVLCQLRQGLPTSDRSPVVCIPAIVAGRICSVFVVDY